MRTKGLKKERDKLKREEYRKSILRAAEEIILRKGYTTMTMDDVARKAQLSKATIYNYFRNKGEMVVEILFLYFEDVERRMAEIAALKTGAREKLRELVVYYLNLNREKENVSRVLLMEPALMKKLGIFILGDPKAATAKEKVFLKRFKDKWQDIFLKAKEMFAEGIRAGEFREMDAGEAVMFLNSVLLGYSHGKNWMPAPKDIGGETEFLCSFLLQGMERRNDRHKGVA